MHNAPDAIDPDWAWRPYEPDAERPWTLERASHLYRRAALGATLDELERAERAGPQAAVDQLLAPPAALDAEDRQFDAYDAASDSPETLQAWWLQRMMQTAWPFRERMTLFWHNHFATAAAGASGSLLRAHVALLRRHALGRFPELLAEVLIDPAVLIGLQATENRRARPHEDTARAVLEHWGVGPGNFSDDDVRALACAYTGWYVLRERRRYIEREHEPAPQELLGQGNVAGIADAARALAAHPAARRLIARKLYRTFISEEAEPPDALVAPLAEALGREGDTAAVVGTVLRSNLFFSPAVLRQRVKSPVEFALGLIRPLEGTVPALRLGQDLAAMGHHLYRPPTMAGWPRGRAWLDSAALIARANLVAAVFSGEEPYAGKIDPLGLAERRARHTGQEVAGLLVELLVGCRAAPEWLAALAGEMPAAAPQRREWARDLACRIAMLPETHLS